MVLRQPAHKNRLKRDFLGVNFYPWSYVEWAQRTNGLPRHILRSTHGSKLGEVIERAYTRYQMPLIVTETSAKRDVAGRARWMDQTLDSIRGLRAQGVPVVGYTWFPFLTMVDWTYRRGRKPLTSFKDCRSALLRGRGPAGPAHLGRTTQLATADPGRPTACP